MTITIQSIVEQALHTHVLTSAQEHCITLLLKHHRYTEADLIALDQLIKAVTSGVVDWRWDRSTLL